MRNRLVGTDLGSAFLELGRWQVLRRIPFKNPEQASSVANAILADRLLPQLCPPKGLFIDIGSVFATVHRYDPTIRIIAIEAEPEKAAYLSQRFPFARIIGVAVGEEAGTCQFFLNPTATGYNSLIPSKGSMAHGIEVETVRLDDILPDTEVDVLKIDIEGSELGALRGGEKLVRRNAPTIMFESAGAEVNDLGYSAALLWEWFHAMDYMLFTPNRLAHDAPPLSLEAFLDAHEYPFRTLNYFAVARARRVEVRYKARKILDVRAAARSSRGFVDEMPALHAKDRRTVAGQVRTALQGRLRGREILLRQQESAHHPAKIQS